MKKKNELLAISETKSHLLLRGRNSLDLRADQGRCKRREHTFKIKILKQNSASLLYFSLDLQFHIWEVYSQILGPGPWSTPFLWNGDPCSPLNSTVWFAQHVWLQGTPGIRGILWDYLVHLKSFCKRPSISDRWTPYFETSREPTIHTIHCFSALAAKD